MPNDIPEGCPAAAFVNQVLVPMEYNWHDYVIPVDWWDDVMAWLTLLHIPMRCRVESQDAEVDEFEEEVSRGYV